MSHPLSELMRARDNPNTSVEKLKNIGRRIEELGIDRNGSYASTIESLIRRKENANRLRHLEIEEGLKRLIDGRYRYTPELYESLLKKYSNQGGNRVNYYRRMGNVLRTKDVPLVRNTKFLRFVNSLYDVTKHNQNVTIQHDEPDVATLVYTHPNKSRSFVQFVPYYGSDESGPQKGVYINYGETSKTARGQGIGTRLRKYGINAAAQSHLPVFHQGVNFEHLVSEGEKPLSTKIIEKLGGVRTKTLFGSEHKWASVVPPPSRPGRAVPYGRRRRPYGA